MVVRMPKRGYILREVKSPPSHTVAELRQLTQEWIAEQEGDTEMLKWTFSIWLAWLAQREQRKGGER